MHGFHEKKFGVLTWVKMESPSIEGLKFALLDEHKSLNRGQEADPHKRAELVIGALC